VLLLVTAAPLSACFSYQTASSGAVGCPPGDIVIRDKQVKPSLQGPTRTWTAICGDRQHQCSSVGAPSTAACTEVVDVDAVDRLDDYRFARSFDAQRNASRIEAHLRIDVRRSLELFAVPSADASVRVIVRLLSQRDVQCDRVRFIANSVPVASTLVAVRREAFTHRLDVDLGEPLLRELRRPHPTLTLEGCGQSLTLDPRAMATLGDFTRMYDDLAKTP
jgi:hypothetical protein